MIVRLKQAFKKGKPGDLLDVSRPLARQLEAEGIAVIHGDQTRLDVPPKQNTDMQPLQVHNHYYLGNPDEGENFDN